jgi:putative membrane protein
MNADFIPDVVNSPEVAAFFAGFPVTLLHAGITLLILVLASCLYAMTTPFKEITAIRDGNGAAAVSFGGVIVGLAIPLAMALNASSSTRELVIWGGATALVQLLVFRLTDFVLMGLPSRVYHDGEVPAAVLLVAAKLAGAFIIAAAVAG